MDGAGACALQFGMPTTPYQPLTNVSWHLSWLGQVSGKAGSLHHSQVLPIVHQKVKQELPLGPGGVAAGNPVVIGFTTCTSYTPTELWELGKQC